MVHWIAIPIFLFLTFTTSSLWAHGNESHEDGSKSPVVGMVIKASDDHIVVKTLDGKSVSIGFRSETTFQRITHKNDRPQVGDRLVAEVSKEGENLVGQEIRFSTPKSK